jgi:hypothetical protein
MVTVKHYRAKGDGITNELIVVGPTGKAADYRRRKLGTQALLLPRHYILARLQNRMLTGAGDHEAQAQGDEIGAAVAASDWVASSG